MTRGTPNEEYYKLTREDELKLKTLLKYAFADSPSFDNLTDIERGILGDKETFVRIVSWSCEGEVNEYVGAPNLSSPIGLDAEEPQGHSPLCASRVGGECTCGEFERQDAPTVTLDELKSSAHELTDYSSAREASRIMKELGL